MEDSQLADQAMEEIDQTVQVAITADSFTAVTETDPSAVISTEPDPAITTYSVFVPSFEKPVTLISSTFERYNDTIRDSIKKDTDIVQQKVDVSLQSNTNNFFKNAKWSPDGSHLLTNSADDIIRVFPLSTNVYEDTPDSDKVIPLMPRLGIKEGESLNDFAWFPSMNAQDPSTCCFITSVRDHPIRLWDLNSGAVRASYSAIDHTERFIGPNVVSFNLDGSKIYCGYENMIEIFNVHRPGSESTKHATIPKRKSRKGQKGIISCLDFCPDYSGLYAAGSYSQSIGIYDETNNELCLKLTGFVGGATQVKFSKDGLYLFSASRHSNSILCWDIRDSENILYELPRPGKTNQRITFDMDATGKYLMTGDEFGNMLVYDISTGASEDIETKKRIVSSSKAHEDIISCATFNPVYPVIATCSGQRKFPLAAAEDSSDEEEDKEMDKDNIVDNTLKFWRVHGEYEWFSYDAAQSNVMEQ